MGKIIGIDLGTTNSCVAVILFTVCFFIDTASCSNVMPKNESKENVFFCQTFPKRFVVLCQ